MTPEVQTAISGLILVLIGVLGAWLERIRRDLADNTAVTHGARGAAEDAQIAAKAASLAARMINDCQIDQAELDQLRRWKSAFDTLPECQPCQDAIRVIIERRRLRPPQEHDHDRQ